MSEQEQEQPAKDTKKEISQTAALLIDGIVRMNSMYDPNELAEQDELVLEALYKAEQIRENSNNKKKKENEKPTFLTAPIKRQELPKKKQNKDPNADDIQFKFNSMEIFKPQYIHRSRLRKFEDGCEILSMRVHLDPRLPEWKL